MRIELGPGESILISRSGESHGVMVANHKDDHLSVTRWATGTGAEPGDYWEPGMPLPEEAKDG
ncbi:MAG: hypothetical protein V3V32_04320 [Dehalococcoidia bacterium]